MKRIFSNPLKTTKGLFLLLLLASSSGISQSTFSFLNTPANARLAALGGVNVSLTNRDVNFFVNNPSLSGDTLNSTASASYQFYLADIGQSNFSYQHRFRKVGSLAFNVQHMNYGSITGYDASGAEIGEFSSGETALTAGKYFQSSVFRFGVNVKAVFSKLAGYNSSAIGIDLGGLFVHPKKELTIGLAVKNLGVTLSDYSSTSSSVLPFDVQVGTTFKPEHMPFRFSITAFDLTDFDSMELEGDEASTADKVVRHLNVATELLMGKHVNILLGYNFRTRQELKLEETGGGAGVSLGLVLNIKNVEFVVSRSGYGPRQAAYGFTLATNMKSIMRKKKTI
jgi:hypothetical protein